MITATGLGSGLDISGLVSQLVAAERAGSDLQLNRQNAKLTSKFSALGELKSKLSGFQTSLGGLSKIANFAQFTGTSSIPEELGVTVTDKASANNYSVEISQLATSHALAAPPVVDRDTTAVGVGTLTFRFGTTDYNSVSDTYNSFALNPDSNISTITIDSTNNTLEGVMGAINNADIGVKASIVNDGNGYRLLMSGDATGGENSIEISVSNDEGSDIDGTGLSMFAFNSAATNVDQTAQAIDAQLNVNGLPITSASNEVDFAIAGVTLSLKETSIVPIEIKVEADTSSILNAVNGFVAGYNQYIGTVNSLSSYDAANDIPGALLGDFSVRSINGQIDRILRNSVTGVDSSISTLSAIGITTNSSGKLDFSFEKFNKILKEKPDEVAKIFAAIGSPENSDISFNSATTDTQVGDYDIEITALASAGSLTGAGALPDFGGGGSVVIDDDNNSFSIVVDGVEAGEINLTLGTYSDGDSLAAEIQARINGKAPMRTAGVSVEVTFDSGSNSFSIISNSLGKTSSVNITTVDTNTTAALGFSVATGVLGTDVEGTINGTAAEGTGNVLVAGSGSPAEGLSLVVDATTTGSFGNINFTRGLGAQLEVLFNQMLETDGALSSRISTLEERISDVADRREILELRWQTVEARYLKQFNALDTLLAGLQSTSSYLETQLASLPTPFSGSRG